MVLPKPRTRRLQDHAGSSATWPQVLRLNCVSPERWPRALIALAVCLGMAILTQGQERTVQPTTALVNDMRIDRIDEDEPGAWLAYGRGYREHRFSPLTQVNRETVRDLGLAWSRKIEVRHRLQSSPIVVDGVIYYTDSWSVVSAVDADTGETIWTFDPQTQRRVARWSCCGGPINRGVAVYQGRVYTATFDARLFAIDAATGAKVWEVDTGDYPSRIPYTISGAPLAAAGKVYIGNSGSEWDHRGYVTAYDAATGEKLWRFFTVPGDPSEPFEHPELEEAAKTWHRLECHDLRHRSAHGLCGHREWYAVVASDPLSRWWRQSLSVIDRRLASRYGAHEVVLPNHPGGQLGLYRYAGHGPG